MSGNTTRTTLLIRVQNADDSAAWDEFEARYKDLVYNYCRSRGLQAADCEDVQQLVWMHLSRGMRNFEYDPGKGRFRDYLGCIVRNAISRHFRREDQAKTPLDTTLLAILSGDQLGSDHEWEREWVDHHYRLAMSTLQQTFEPKSVLMFERLLAGQSVSEIARSFKTSEQSVHKVKQRIRARLKELIAEQIREEDGPETQQL